MQDSLVKSIINLAHTPVTQGQKQQMDSFKPYKTCW